MGANSRHNAATLKDEKQRERHMHIYLIWNLHGVDALYRVLPFLLFHEFNIGIILPFCIT